MERQTKKLRTKILIKAWIEMERQEQLHYFNYLNPYGGHYTPKQKAYTIEKVLSTGIRATSRLLQVPRRTIQRWLRAEEITVKRCPDWVYDWASSSPFVRENCNISPVSISGGQVTNLKGKMLPQYKNEGNGFTYPHSAVDGRGQVYATYNDVEDTIFLY